VQSRVPNQGGSLWAARDLLWEFVRRDLTVRYRSAVLGVAWAVLAPVMQTVIFTVIFARLTTVNTEMPYPLFAFSGLALWGFSAAALRGAVTSLSSHAFLVSKVPFRREVLPLASVLVAAVDFGVSLVILGGVMWFYGVGVHTTVLLLPLLLVVHLAFVAGLALLLSTANLWWNDVRHVFEAAVTLWMFASAVLYPLPPVGGTIGTILAWNPMTRVIEGFRDLVIRGQLPDAAASVSYAMTAAVVLAIGLTVFRRTAPRFAEVA
jgi:ABC-type polysaccharide/polyol phosphate export permease